MPPINSINPLNAVVAALFALVMTPALALFAPARVLAMEPVGQGRYRCHGEFDAVEVRALFFNQPPSEVILLYGEGAERLLQQRSASGGRYSDGDQVFWIKGDTATWQRGRTMHCQTIAPDR